MKYTKQQAQDFLKNKKVYVNGKSEEIQKKLFECGCKWRGSSREVSCTSYPFLYIDKKLDMTWGDDMNHFSNRDLKEITAEEILSIELIEEPKFKPFDKVLVRDYNHEPWSIEFFNSMYKSQFECIMSVYNQCIPYEGNEHLHNTVKSPEQC